VPATMATVSSTAQAMINRAGLGNYIFVAGDRLATAVVCMVANADIYLLLPNENAADSCIEYILIFSDQATAPGAATSRGGP
jgi:hypothetical protein